MNRFHASSLALALALASGSATAGDATAGQAKYAGCGGCHGMDGVSLTPDVNPSVKGLSADDVKAKLAGYKDGSIQHPTMNAMAAGLSDDDIGNLAAYIGTL
ncbi:MAG: c-type cytochrome [Pseudomonadota bacterium]